MAHQNFNITASDGQVFLGWKRHRFAPPGTGPYATIFRVFRELDSSIDWDNNEGNAIATISTSDEDGSQIDHSYTDTNVTNGTTYYYLVVAYRGSAESASPVKSATPMAVVTGDAPTATPTGLSGTRLSSTSLSASWNPVSGDGTISYNFAYWETTVGWSYRDVSGTSITLTGLISGGTYYISVRAMNEFGNGPYTTSPHPSVALTSSVVVPSAPSAPSVTTVDEDSITVSWSSVSGATGYDIQYRVSGTTAWSSPVSTAATSRTINGLNADTTYEVQVRAKNSAGPSEWSSSGTGATAEEEELESPPTPAGVSLSVIDDTTLRLSWNSVAEATSFQGEYRVQGTSDYIRISGNITSAYDITGLNANTTYEARVRSTNSAGSSLFSSAASATTEAEPESFPITLSLVSVGSGVVRLAWSRYRWQPSNSIANGYQIWSREGNSGDFSQLGGTVDKEHRSGYDITGLTNDQLYGFRVRARTDDGQHHSGYSNIVSATPTAGDVVVTPTEAPGIPTSIAATGVDQDSLRVTWSEGTGGDAETYNLRFREGSSGTWTTRSDVESGYQIDSLKTETSYQVQVQASNSVGTSAWSSSATGVTLAATDTMVGGEGPTPSEPRRFQGDAQSVGVILRWLTPTHMGTGGNIDGYNIWRWHGGTWSEIVTDTNSTSTTYTDTASLTIGQWYWYAIRALNPSGNGEWSAVIPVLINPSLPSAPRRLNVDARSTGVLVDWEAPADTGTGGNIDGYNIWRWYAGVWTEVVTDTNSTSTTYTDTASLQVGETYWYVVRAINSAGPGEWSETSGAVINPELPSAPLRLVLTETINGIVLDWLPPEDSGTGGAVNGYNIWRYSDAAWSEIVVDTGSTLTIYTDSSILSEGWHHYALRARNSAGPGEWSETSGVTTATNVPGPPTSLIAIKVEGGIKLTWEPPLSNGGSPITGYRISRSDGIEWVILVNDTGTVETSYLDTVVMTIGAGIYFYRVNAITKNGVGDFSAVASIGVTGTLVIEMPERTDNRVFGNWWISVRPNIVNPSGNFLTYKWTQSGGIIINSDEGEFVYIQFPEGVNEDQPISLTLTIVDMVTNVEISETIDYIIVAEPNNESLFFNLTTTEIPGVLWYDWAQIWEYTDEADFDSSDVGLVDSRLYETRAYVPVHSNYVKTNPAYVALLTMASNGRISFHLSDIPDDPGYGAEPNPQLSDDGEMNMGMALRLPDGTEYKWGFDELVKSDTSDPYNFSASTVAAAGQTNNQAFRNALFNFWNARIVIVDRTSSFVDWDDLSLIAINPTVSIEVVDTTTDSGATQTISGLFDDFHSSFSQIGLTATVSNGTLGEIQRDDVAGFWNVEWSAPDVMENTLATTLTIRVVNLFNRVTEAIETIETRAIFEPVFPEDLTLSDITQLRPEDQLKDITNIVKVPVRQFNVTEEIELWNLQSSIELGPEESRIFLINYPDDAAPRSHLAVSNWSKLRLQDDPEFVFGPIRNTFGTSEGEIETARRERNDYARQVPEWFEEYTNSNSLMVRLLGASRSGAVYEVYNNGTWEEVSPVFPDYTANSQSDGNGNDRTDELEIVLDDGGNTRRILVKNTSLTDTIHLTTLRSRGRVIQEIQKTVVEVRDEASIDRYGPKDYTSESQYLSSIDHAHEYGTHVLFLYSEPRLKVKVRFHINEFLFLAYSLQISDRVALTRKGETEDFFVESIEHLIQPGLRHDMQVTLAPVPVGNAIILGLGPPLGVGTLGR